MSQIFDALQRSEAEGTGAESSRQESSTFAVATELLEVAERKRRTASPATVDGASVDRPEHSNAFEPFPSLPVSILPHCRLVSVGEEESLGAEKFRFLAVRLRQLRQSRTLKKVLITSTIPQEGKS